MQVSDKGLIEIMSLEGVCLSPYLDSVSVWTIGVGITKADGKDPRDYGTITIDQAIAMFKEHIRTYSDAVSRLGKDFSQTQFDALTSFCYNCGEGNLRKLCTGRGISEIGTALMLYRKPPEITARRQKEQNLYRFGTYSSKNKVLVFPVSSSHHPVYAKGYELDVSKYFSGEPVPTPIVPIPANPSIPETPIKTPPAGLSLSEIWNWLKTHL